MAQSKPATPGRTVIDSSLSHDQKLAAAWRWVDVPKRDPFFRKSPHPAIKVNNMSFEAGRRYLLPPELATTVEDRIQAFQEAQLRLMNPEPLTEEVNSQLNGSHAADTRKFSPEAEQFAEA